MILNKKSFYLAIIILQKGFYLLNDHLYILNFLFLPHLADCFKLLFLIFM